MDFALLLQTQRRPTEAYELLAPIYGQFTEGFSTTDLRRAKSLLDELRASSSTGSFS
jgi:predicted ATPase